MKKWVSFILAITMVCALAACGKKTSSETPTQTDNSRQATEPEMEPAETPAQTAIDQQATEPDPEAEDGAVDEVPEDGQNPVMNFIGIYGAGRATMQVEAEGAEDAKITVTWGSSAWENSEWVMSGKLDTETLTVSYTNCVRTDRVYGEDGSISSENVAYENGTGRILFSATDYSLTWEDDQENVAEGMTFLGGLPETEDEPNDPAIDEAMDAQRFVGIWESDRVTIEISPNPDEGYRCLVSWGSSATENTAWKYQCYLDGEALYSYKNGTKTNMVWGDDGEMVSNEVVFSDGAARFEINEDGQLLWHEFKEDAGEGMTFDHVDTPTPTAEELVENYFHVIGGYGKGTAGSTISEALSACDVIRFASGNALWAVDDSSLRANLLEAWESMSEEERMYFDDNFMDVVMLIDSCVTDWEANKGTFEDGGAAEDMEMLLNDPTALTSWYKLRNHTLTLGNSDG